MPLDVFALLLRFMLYAGTILAAGSVALRFSLAVNRGGGFDRMLSLQTGFGLATVLLASLALIAKFLLTISGGDWAMAFSAEFIGIALQTPVGQSGLVRIIAACVLAVTLLAGWRWLAFIAAFGLLLSFGLEGHSMSYGIRLVSMVLVVVHVMIVSWWLAVLLPLMASPVPERDAMGHAFGQRAVFAVPLLMIAGALLLGTFTGWNIDLSQDYQRNMLLKLFAVSGLLLIAAANKLYFTGKPTFIWALRVETLVAAIVLILTTLLTATGPDM